MLVIINADDLGATKIINDIIFKLMEEGRITSGSLLANAPNLEEALSRIPDFPNQSFGVHLNITQYAPLSLDKRLSVIRDVDGNFADLNKICEVKFTSDLIRAIYNEFCAQIDKLLFLGLNISHIDSHNHVHVIPQLFPIIKYIQKKYLIRKIRITRNIYSLNYKMPAFLLTKKKVFNFMLRHCYLTKTTNGFGDFLSFYQNAMINNIKYDSVEVMVHPGGGIYYQEETELLQSNWEEKIPYKVKFINYNEL